MAVQKPAVVFDQERASSHDKRFAKLAPLRDALHLFVRMVLAELPAEARILIVGAGTGPELMALAQAYPGWRFTAVEPAAPMLEHCRRQAEDRGIASRCTFHEGHLDSLPAAEPFDAATCILVSQFLLQVEQRRELFRQIAALLRPNGYLVSADLATGASPEAYQQLRDVWARTMSWSGVPAQEVENLGQGVAVLAPGDIESIIAASGFSRPVLFYQALLIHAWFTRRAS